MIVCLNEKLEKGNFIIKKIDGEPKFIEMLSYLGICEGCELEVIEKGYFENSLVVCVNNNRLLLNSDFMDKIYVERVKSLKKVMK